jgi:hypothetical protein
MGRPGFPRAVFGLIAGLVVGPIILALIRFSLSIIGMVNIDQGLLPSTGANLFFAGFGAMVGWLWGIGSFNPYSHDHGGIPTDLSGKPGLMQIAFKKGREAMPGIMQLVRPLIRPLLVALAICLVVTFLFIVIGSTPLGRGQVLDPNASATTIAGGITLPIGNGFVVSKTLFFLIIVLLVLGALATMAVVLALVYNAVNREVNEAKVAPNNPPKTEPLLFRLIDFFVTWVQEILDGTKRSVSR